MSELPNRKCAAHSKLEPCYQFHFGFLFNACKTASLFHTTQVTKAHGIIMIILFCFHDVATAGSLVTRPVLSKKLKVAKQLDE